jgi:hypothetical protein
MIDLPLLGRLAQLGEHHVRNVGVEGSSPLPSTKSPQPAHIIFRPSHNLRRDSLPDPLIG